MVGTIVVVATMMAPAGCAGHAEVSAGASTSAEDSRRNVDGLAVRTGGLPMVEVVSPEPGATVTSPVEIVVRVENYNLAPLGVSRDSEGHLHVIRGDCIEPGEVIGDEHVHLGDGSAVAEIELDAGLHRLCVQLADGFHTAVAITTQVDVRVE